MLVNMNNNDSCIFCSQGVMLNSETNHNIDSSGMLKINKDEKIVFCVFRLAYFEFKVVCNQEKKKGIISPKKKIILKHVCNIISAKNLSFWFKV